MPSGPVVVVETGAALRRMPPLLTAPLVDDDEGEVLPEFAATRGTTPAELLWTSLAVRPTRGIDVLVSLVIIVNKVVVVT